MRAYGHVRCYGKRITRVSRSPSDRAHATAVGVKNRKRERAAARALVRSYAGE